MNKRGRAGPKHIDLIGLLLGFNDWPSGLGAAANRTKPIDYKKEKKTHPGSLAIASSMILIGYEWLGMNLNSMSYPSRWLTERINCEGPTPPMEIPYSGSLRDEILF